MEKSSAYLIDKLLKKLKDLTNYKEEKTKLLSESIALYLKKIPELANYINENIPDNESKVLFEVGKYLKYARYQKGQFIKHCYDTDDFFYMIFTGDVAKIDIKYNRLYVSFKEYLMHLIRLRLLGENYIYLKCIKKNQNVFPFDENMDILTTTEINIDHYDELVKKIKKEVNNSKWFTNTDKNNDIEDFLKLYNPEKSNIRDAFIGKETKYPAFLPFYTFDKIMDPIAFVGHLTKPKGIRFISSYVCLNICDIFYVNKTIIDDNSNLFKLFQRTVAENVIKKLFERHFLFKDADKSFLIKSYSKYFFVQKYTKGNKLIQQNTPHEGIFFIKSGIFQLKTFRTYNELNALHFSILHALDNFPKAFLDFKSKINDFEKKTRKTDNKNIFEGLSQTQIEKFTEAKNILFNNFVPPDVVGLNDIYDNKNGLNNFTVECISNEAEVYFLPSELVSSMMVDENINNKAGDFIGKQCMLLVNGINKYKESFIKTLQLEKNINNTKENHKFNYSKTLNSFKINNLYNKRNESHKNSIISLKPKNNYSTGFGNISNFSTSKSNNFNNNSKSNYYLSTHTSATKRKKIFKILRNDRYQKTPNIFLSNGINSNGYETDTKIPLFTDIFNNEKIFDKKYKTNLKLYSSKDRKNILKKSHNFNSHKFNLTEREFIMRNNNNGEKYNNSNSIRNLSKSNNNSNKEKILLFNKKNKGILKKYRSIKDSPENILKFSHYEDNKNNKNIPTLFNSVKNSFNKKRPIIDRKYILKNT